jgi:hypothetical protein
MANTDDSFNRQVYTCQNSRLIVLLATKLTGGNGARLNRHPVERLVGGFHFASTNSEYPPNTLAVNGKLNLESSHRGPFATALLIDGCCLKTPKAAFV